MCSECGERLTGQRLVEHVQKAHADIVEVRRKGYEKLRGWQFPPRVALKRAR